MDDIRLSGGAGLPLVSLGGKFVGGDDLAQIILLVLRKNFLDQHVYGTYFFRHCDSPNQVKPFSASLCSSRNTWD